ncbi:MAG: hypothetical protein RLZZ487_2264, partial [Pseudomonadota bacterium]
ASASYSIVDPVLSRGIAPLDPRHVRLEPDTSNRLSAAVARIKHRIEILPAILNRRLGQVGGVQCLVAGRWGVRKGALTEVERHLWTKTKAKVKTIFIGRT